MLWHCESHGAAGRSALSSSIRCFRADMFINAGSTRPAQKRHRMAHAVHYVAPLLQRQFHPSFADSGNSSARS